MFKKGQSGNPAGKKPGTKNKPKPFIVKLREAFGESVSENDLKELAKKAMAHASGDVIIKESADGQVLEAKCVSDPRLFLGLGKMVADSEEKRPSGYGALPPILDGLRKELENYGEAE